MSDRAVLPGRDAGSGPDREGDREDDDLTSLRSILLGPAEQRLQALQARIDDRFAQARDVGAVLPQALLQRARDPELARALVPPVEKAITASVRRDPRPLAAALFPVIGPAIRKAVAASLATMVESLNRTLEYSFSWRALNWRIEALRTGKPFGEIVLLHMLLYRVEQVFLIHRQTGLLLQHVRAGPARVEDAQMVSAMLTAIRDFVQDSFRVPEHDSLDALRVGDLSVWVEQGPAAILAAVIRGNVPQERRRALQETLETIHLQFADALESFEGDAAPFDASRPILEECLATEYRAEPGRRRPGALILLAAVLVAVAVWAGFWFRDRARWIGYLEALRNEPGLVVISDGRRDGKRFVNGMRDPLARDPQEILIRSRLSPASVIGRWEPYQALTPEFVLERARDILQPPSGVTLALEGTVLSATGRAPVAWIAEARRLAPLMAGVSRFDTVRLMDSEIQSLTDAIESVMLFFEKGAARLVPGQDAQLASLGTRLQELDALAAQTDRTFRVDVVGHTDADGAPDSNLPLSRARAELVAAELPLQSAPRLVARAIGAGSGEPLTSGRTEADNQRNRRVALRISEAPASRSQDRPR